MNDVQRDVVSWYQCVIIKVRFSEAKHQQSTKKSLVNITQHYFVRMLCVFFLRIPTARSERRRLPIATNCRSLQITCSSYSYDML